MAEKLLSNDAMKAHRRPEPPGPRQWRASIYKKTAPLTGGAVFGPVFSDLVCDFVAAQLLIEDFQLSSADRVSLLGLDPNVAHEIPGPIIPRSSGLRVEISQCLQIAFPELGPRLPGIAVSELVQSLFLLGRQPTTLLKLILQRKEEGGRGVRIDPRDPLCGVVLLGLGCHPLVEVRVFVVGAHHLGDAFEPVLFPARSTVVACLSQPLPVERASGDQAHQLDVTGPVATAHRLVRLPHARRDVDADCVGHGDQVDPRMVLTALRVGTFVEEPALELLTGNLGI